MKIIIKKISEAASVLDHFITFEGDREGLRHSHYSHVYLKNILSFPFSLLKEGFVFYANDIPIARVLIEIDKATKSAHFSFFSLKKEICEKNFDLFKETFDEIIKYASTYEVEKILGPYFYSTYLPYRFRVDSEEDSYSWEPNTPLYEYDFFMRLGFSDLEAYFSNFSDDFSPWDTLGEKHHERLLKRGYTFLYLEKSNINKYIRIIYDLSIESFKDNYLFKEIPYPIFEKYYLSELSSIDTSLSHLVLYKNEVVGFFFCFLDGDNLVLKSTCTKEAFRGRGILAASSYEAVIKCKELYPHAKKACSALIHDKNLNCIRVAKSKEGETMHFYKLVWKKI